jgi:TonB family protein
MAEKAFEASRDEDNLDWNKLSVPVPMDLIDPEFPSHPPEAPAMPGSRSEILSREESEAVANSADPTLEMTARESTLEMPAREPVQDEFARIRAKMDAEAEAEKNAKLEAEKEEASQRERLEQWMANARARLLKADADLTGPSGRIRIRKDSSPSLYRLAEMQKTIWVEGQATQVDSPNAIFNKDDQSKTQPLDPMATISVPTEQFLSLDAPAQPTMREQALARQAAQQASQQAAVQQAESRAKEMAKAKAKAPPQQPQAPQAPQDPNQATPPARTGQETQFQPMTREQALTRKVAQLRKVAEGGENTLAIAPQEEPAERSALHFAIAAVVIIAIAVLGLGLFAATQAGLFDGLENRIPFLRPELPPTPAAPAAKPPVPRPVSAPSALSAPPGNQPPPSKPITAVPAASLRPVPSQPAVAPAPARVQSIPAKPIPAKPMVAVSPVPARPAAKVPAATPASKTRRSAPAPAAAAAAPSEPVADEDGETHAYGKTPPKASNLGEIMLRASIQAAANIDTDNLNQLYNRYALGFPGLSGEVVIGLTVDPSGRILEGSVVNSTTGADAFDQELLRKVMEWRLRPFPESRPKFITVPFLFPLQGR